MTAIQYFWRHPLAEQVREEGREEGRLEERAGMVLRILQLRGIEVPDSVRERVEGCADLDRLETWVERALRVENADDLFEG
jgi:hypothetical protein